MKSRLLLTAGFDGALHVVAIAELLRRREHSIAGIVVVSPWSLKRVRKMLRQSGWSGLMKAATRLFKVIGPAKTNADDQPIRDLLARYQITHRSLERWAKDQGVPIWVVRSLNERGTVKLIEDMGCDGMIYGGGGILHNPIIEAVKGRVLNAHSGPLPYIRGMNACEWSLLLDYQPAVTIHFIERGIDTGAIVDVLKIEVQPGDTVGRLRAKCVAAGVEGLVKHADAVMYAMPQRHPDASKYRQCYVMAPAIFELLQSRLASANVRQLKNRSLQESHV
jgi:folate-dependent phosphoribosylglycinamide formyltransferase PurN